MQPKPRTLLTRVTSKREHNRELGELPDLEERQLWQSPVGAVT